MSSLILSLDGHKHINYLNRPSAKNQYLNVKNIIMASAMGPPSRISRARPGRAPSRYALHKGSGSARAPAAGRTGSLLGKLLRRHPIRREPRGRPSSLASTSRLQIWTSPARIFQFAPCRLSASATLVDSSCRPIHTTPLPSQFATNYLRRRTCKSNNDRGV